ncbi:hypothetical protein V1279_006064 [Bradyrhizobium sp. AZCC 1610]|uniref:hypothetical protein n=1 Tax=Bradyrhizobium sp. AZCC 1610 TaxID=3117020 RepID=UPI002FF1EC8E
MSQIFKAFLAALAIFATFGAVQLASGHDLTGRRQLASTAPTADINRAAKADRAALRAAQNQTDTITIRSVGLDDTSVVVRVPVVQAPVVQGPVVQEPVVQEQVRNRPAPPAKPGASKTAIACEPPVSVLTEVAKLLQPGRCVT